MRKIEGFQIKKIYAIGNALGITKSGSKDDDLHILIGGSTGKDSVKELSYPEASKVIAHLEKLQGHNTPPVKPKGEKEHTSVPGGITSEQQKKVWALMYELRKYDRSSAAAALGDRLCGIIKKELGVDSTAKSPFVWIDFAAGNKLIEILKKYVLSAEKQTR